MSSKRVALISLKNHDVKRGNYRDSTYIHYILECDAVQDLVDDSFMPTTNKVVLPDEMELKVYVFPDGIHD